MSDEKIIFDVGRLRKDMKKEAFGAFFGGGFGGALMESFDIDRMSDRLLVEMAEKKGINLKKYQL